MRWFSKKNRVVSQQAVASLSDEAEVKTPSENEQRQASSLSTPEAWLLEIMGAQPALSGVTVNPRTAMGCTPVRAAVQAIAEPLGSLPVIVYKRTGDGKERASDHPVYRLLHDRANPWTSATDFREQLARDALLHGDGLAFINRDSSGQPVELLRLTSDAIQISQDDLTGEPSYKATTGSQRVFAASDVIHIKAPSLDGYSGLSIVSSCKEAIGLALVLEQHAARLFGNGAKPSGILSVKNTLKDGALANIRAAWVAAHGAGKSGNTAVLDADTEYQQLTMSSVDAQFQEMRAFAVAEIARAFRVPPILLQDLGRATFNNSEALGQQFLTFTLLPWIKRIEGEIALKLFAGDDEHFAEYLVDDLLRADFAARAESYSKLIAARVLNPNECRAMENRPAYEGGNAFENPNTSTQGAAQTKEPAANG
ncbi:phage portal protein [Labrys sp. 22185]|uniref:phage portal protein n=1 Tax=Labrys sp. 22185 TaxID=3453888 RepID=UPI003F84AE4C